MIVRRIDRPNWSRGPRVTTEGVSDEMMERLRSAREGLLATVHSEICSYLSDPQLVFDSADEFPSTQRLTGEYYISDEYYHVAPESGRVRISITAHCLAHPLQPQAPPDDYLGLEVWLESDADSRSFSVFRNTDSSVI